MPYTTLISTAVFADNAGVEFDPTTVTATVTRGNGTVEVFTTSSVYPPAGIENTSVGTFKLKIDWEVGTFFKVEWYGENPQGKRYKVHTSYIDP